MHPMVSAIPPIAVTGLVLAILLYWHITRQPGAYILGGLSSVLAGLLGMKAATKTNVRTTEAARAHGTSRAPFNGL